MLFLDCKYDFFFMCTTGETHTHTHTHTHTRTHTHAHTHTRMHTGTSVNIHKDKEEILAVREAYVTIVWGVQDGHLDYHLAPELCPWR